MKQAPLVTLTTDFGTADGYVGTMKGVILGIVPDACIVDLSHGIAPQDVREAAYVLYSAYRFFPPHTVHLVVVDPGVGSARRSVALHTPSGTFVGPDNGVFSYMMAQEQVESLVELVNPRYRLSHVSHTFHGRDIFAPAAAHLAAGVRMADLGPAVTDPVTLTSPRLELATGKITGEVLHVDRFGNVVTSIGRLSWDGDGLLLEPAFEAIEAQVKFGAADAVVTIVGHEVAGVHRIYAKVAPGEMLALVGSSGHLEIAVREGSAAERLGVRVGDEIVLRF